MSRMLLIVSAFLVGIFLTSCCGSSTSTVDSTQDSKFEDKFFPYFKDKIDNYLTIKGIGNSRYEIEAINDAKKLASTDAARQIEEKIVLITGAATVRVKTDADPEIALLFEETLNTVTKEVWASESKVVLQGLEICSEEIVEYDQDTKMYRAEIWRCLPRNFFNAFVNNKMIPEIREKIEQQNSSLSDDIRQRLYEEINKMQDELNNME